MKDLKFVLVTEVQPNSFDPIYWSQNSMYDLESIDDFSSRYYEEEFRENLIRNALLSSENKNVNLEIIYDNKGIKKLKGGLIYKNEYSSNMVEYIKLFIKDNQNNANIFNNLYQKVLSDKLISQFSKKLFEVIFNNRHLPYDEIKVLLDKLRLCRYLDIRIMYLYIKRELEPKLNENKKKILNKKDEN